MMPVMPHSSSTVAVLFLLSLLLGDKTCSISGFTSPIPSIGTNTALQPPSRCFIPRPLRSSPPSKTTSPPDTDTDTDASVNYRTKVNEIDFCMAPSDVSLSRAYSNLENFSADIEMDGDGNDDGSRRETTARPPSSLTRALNSASNRAVRRILLSRSWPSAEALNRSLRLVLSGGGGAGDAVSTTTTTTPTTGEGEDSKEESGKCPIPRPILNVLMRNGDSSPRKNDPVVSRVLKSGGRTDEEYVRDQMEAFRSNYGVAPGYGPSEAYLECILSLATSGFESERVQQVLSEEVYDEPYRRLVNVLLSAGVVFEEEDGRRKIARKLVDQDICLSVMDKIAINTEKNNDMTEKNVVEEVVVVEEEKIEEVVLVKEEVAQEVEEPKKKPNLFFWQRPAASEAEPKAEVEPELPTTTSDSTMETTPIKPEDLGGVLLSSSEPSMTRQLNVLTNIVQRALLFGGDQELLVLWQTLEADLPAFIRRWYPDEGPQGESASAGVQYLKCLVLTLKTASNQSTIVDLSPPLPLTSAYTNAYTRLLGTLVELGSGYVVLATSTEKRLSDIKSNKPKTATEELARFSQWETTFRQKVSDVAPYPDELVGSWEVKDEVAGKTIGVSTVTFEKGGNVEVNPPLVGLRWRLDPGPTHLDTCVFQVLGDDGAILQYKGFLDRGARLESRFSKRAVRVRGMVTFQMRDSELGNASEGYRKDVLPIGGKLGTTKFSMTKINDALN